MKFRPTLRSIEAQPARVISKLVRRSHDVRPAGWYHNRLGRGVKWSVTRSDSPSCLLKQHPGSGPVSHTLHVTNNSCPVMIISCLCFICRYWGVIYPLKPKLTKTRAKFALIVIWVAAMALASAQLVVARSTQQMYGDKRFWDCDEKWRWEEARHSYTLAVVSMTYVIPLGVLCFTYYKVGTKLWVRNAPGNAHQSRDQILLRSKRKVTG